MGSDALFVEMVIRLGRRGGMGWIGRIFSIVFAIAATPIAVFAQVV